jgi:hypothetical protein
MSDSQLLLVFDATMADKFRLFHESNPHVYCTLRRLAREWINRTGKQKLGIGALYERARWDIAIQTNDPEFKLNNNYRAFYARLLMARERDLDGIFQLRGSLADQWVAEYLPKVAS